MTKKMRRVGKYEVGRTIGEGTFAKVKFARNTDTGENVAIKIMAKSTILKHRMVDQVCSGLFFYMIFRLLRLILCSCFPLCYSPDKKRDINNEDCSTP